MIESIRKIGPTWIVSEIRDRSGPRMPPKDRPVYSKPTAADRPAPRDYLWRHNGELS